MNDQFSLELAFSPRSGYQLVLPTKETEDYDTAGALLYALNLRQQTGKNRLFSDAGKAQVILPSGEHCDVIRGSNRFGIQRPPPGGNCVSLIDEFVNELERYGLDVDGQPKQPWQMTMAEWGALSALSDALHGLSPFFTTEQLRQECQTPEGGSTTPLYYGLDLFRRSFGYGPNGPTYDGTDFNSRHEIHVGYALALGKPVPQSVITEYQSAGWLQDSSDCAWICELVNKPFLRGLGSPGRLKALISLLRHNDPPVTLTELTAPEILAAVSKLPDSNVYNNMDNVLYGMGVLTKRPVKMPAANADVPTAHNEFASALGTKISAQMRMNGLTRRQSRLLAGEMSQRAFDSECAWDDAMQARPCFIYPNRIAVEIENKNLDYLIQLFEDGEHRHTAEIVEQFYQVKLAGVSKAARRRGVFALAGYVSEEAYALAEIDFNARMQSKKAAAAVQKLLDQKQEAFEASRNKAAAVNFKHDGATFTGAAFIEKIVGQGFVEITSTGVGRGKQHFLRNPEQGSGFRLFPKHGTLAYAEALLDRQPVAA